MNDFALRLWRQLHQRLYRAPRLELDFARPQRQSRATGLIVIATAALLLALSP